MKGKSAVGVVAEHFDGRIRPVSYEAAACAMQLAKIYGLPVKGVAPGDDPAGPAEEFAKETGFETLAIKGEGLDTWTTESWSNFSKALFESGELCALVAANTVRASQCMHFLAAVCDARAVPGVEEIRQEKDGVVFRRSAFGSKLWELIPTDAGATFPVLSNAERLSRQRNAESTKIPPLFLLTQPGAYPMANAEPAFSPQQQTAAATTVIDIQTDAPRTRLVKRESARSADAALTQADVIVAAGRGIGAKENLRAIEDLAAKFSNAAVGASRPLCDAGWLAYNRQVGQTGATVTPKVYIACGISGSSQHVAGMRGSQFVIAVNTDPAAAIFRHADVGIVEDAGALLSAISEIEEES